ncbi:hypothetical protein AB1L88_15830 [Tautonia sp. JC769]|uniref:hypothetical protein n=1 Tax=Tautonia sp. JC769 TaxID=3232135 RepID=UPI00345794AD
MPLHQLSLETLHTLDLGKVNEAFKTQLARVVQDCLDRPGEQKARKVTLEVTVTPILDPDGDCTDARVQMQVVASTPKLRTREYSMGIRRGGGLVFNEDDPADITRPTMFEDQE